jgi:hypothetical protein
MQILEHELEDGRFQYVQVERQGDVAIYQQIHKASGNVRYEVIRIKIQREHTWPTGVTTPEKEAYPGSGSWGQLGWTFFTLADARQKMAELLTSGAEPPAQEEVEPAAVGHVGLQQDVRQGANS